MTSNEKKDFLREYFCDIDMVKVADELAESYPESIDGHEPPENAKMFIESPTIDNAVALLRENRDLLPVFKKYKADGSSEGQRYGPDMPAAKTEYVQPGIEKKSYPTTGAKVWCVICIVANLAAAGQLMGAMNIAGNYMAIDEIFLFIIFPIIVSFAAVTGFAILLSGRKAGFYCICVCAGIAMLLNLMTVSATGNYSQIFLGFLNPLITYLVLRKSWDGLR